jgi:hypothetical protein
MLFDDINIETITHEDELYINVEQLYNHILGSAEVFSQEAAHLAKTFGMPRDEKYFTMGIVEGMWSIAAVLKYGNKQFEFDSIETVEDLMKRFWNENRTDD